MVGNPCLNTKSRPNLSHTGKNCNQRRIYHFSYNITSMIVILMNHISLFRTFPLSRDTPKENSSSLDFITAVFPDDAIGEVRCESRANITPLTPCGVVSLFLQGFHRPGGTRGGFCMHTCKQSIPFWKAPRVPAICGAKTTQIALQIASSHKQG